MNWIQDSDLGCLESTKSMILWNTTKLSITFCSCWVLLASVYCSDCMFRSSSLIFLSTSWPDLSGMMRKACYDQTFSFLILLLCYCHLYSYVMDLDWKLLCIVTYICDDPGLAVMLICKRCLLIHMNNKGWYFFLWKKPASTN